MAPIESPNVGTAFALVIGAGAATALGASVVFFPSLVKLASKRVLAGALGVSAGVMTYVSFVEIFSKSVGSFEEAGETPERAYCFATLCFFGGVLSLLLISFLVQLLSCEKHHHHHDHPHDVAEQFRDGMGSAGDEEQEEMVAPHCVGCSPDPAGELDEWQQRAQEEEDQIRRNQDKTVASNDISAEGLESLPPSDHDAFNDNKAGNGGGSSNDGDEQKKPKVVVDDALARRENRKLVRMGMNTAIAIGLHNFPEGLATFVAALEDPRVGLVLAIAIGIHNIPEGLCVALPIYYATGNRWKAFFWACISGVSEPIAALLGWAILANSFSYEMYAVLFGLVGGMMVTISARELLPTAHRYDPEDTVVTYSFIAGMMIMALSLVLFQF
mmetsp:Transcript_61237/g.181106  ORF Transcript_61237/g.181106 Transcript_61237/m.181106 type:complete len:386 (-) Transcript_61237:388-1545(-)|eukprot:CAMPEP_0113597840 /NCGR_PEP_ID=MMETSP0015_2-20120614/41241_1 /TAXON_ID=2838 /ORGANISM="Odontella" /LENGTH=385 /DNA_ID=CAMNT_0000505763 /DNA_START=89 /DNA_END=1246 /DNA_ORIENTATION=+ /assembly_acc=CAM_ASM_000160